MGFKVQQSESEAELALCFEHQSACRYSRNFLQSRFSWILIGISDCCILILIWVSILPLSIVSVCFWPWRLLDDKKFLSMLKTFLMIVALSHFEICITQILFTVAFLNSVPGIIVVSTHNPDPMGAFVSLSAQQTAIQQSNHEHLNPYFKWFSAHTFKYYVLLHDVSDGHEFK